MLDVRVAGAADDQGFASTGNHHFDPGRFLGPPMAQQVLERTNMVDLDGVMRATELARIRQKPLFQVRSLVVPDATRLVLEYCILIVLERDSAPCRYQWLLSFSIDRHLKSLVDSIRSLQDRPLSFVDRADTDPL